MKLKLLGRNSAGQKYFSLEAKDAFGYTVELVYKDHSMTLYNVVLIEWLYKGLEVYLVESGRKIIDRDGSYDLTICESVTIKRAKSKSPVKFNYVRHGE